MLATRVIGLDFFSHISRWLKCLYVYDGNKINLTKKSLVLLQYLLVLTFGNINFVTFATFCDNTLCDGYLMSLFYVAIGAVELAVAMYIFYLMYKKKESENIDKYGDL